jgi:predicted Zn-dependent protease
MRLSLLTLILIATLFGSAFWYGKIDTVCKTPVRYYIGNIDDRFGTSKEEIRRIAQSVEKIWEDPLQKDLFIYDEKGTLPINLIFDERQENADIQEELKEDLDSKEGMSESVAQQYEKLIVEFRQLKKQYESRVVSYETALKIYNTEVNEWNKKGGAPESVLITLREKEAGLKTQQSDLEAYSKKLNALVNELNRIGARGNVLITDYNSIVEKYNDRFSEVREFAQGDYTGEAINIYQFDAEDDLTIVLAHEFGHALSLDHVTNEISVMYHHMGAQEVKRGITAEDRAEYTRICVQKNRLGSLIDLVINK